MTASRAAAPTAAPVVGVLAAFAAVYFIWGSTYLGIRIAIETIPPMSMAALRFLSAGAVLFVVSALRGAERPTWAHWRSALVVGVLLLVLGNGLLTWAEQFVASGVAALIVATVPLWMVVLEALGRNGTRPGAAVIAGLALGLAGVVILIGPEEIGGTPIDRPGALVICFAGFSWALGSIYSRRAPQSSSTLQNVGMQMLLGGAILAVVGVVLGERVEPSQVSARSMWALIYLAGVGGIVSYSAYVWLLKVSTPSKVATYAYVNPVVAVLLGWAFAGEPMGPRVLLAAAAVVGAVVLITTARARAATTSSGPAIDR